MGNPSIENAVIRVKAGTVAGTIDPNIYGHFVEHIGGVVYGGIWAEMLRNRSFDGKDYDGNGLADPWEPAAVARMSVTADTAQGFHGERCMRLDLSDTPSAGVQQGGLRLRSDWDYDVEVWAKASGPGSRIEAMLISADGRTTYDAADLGDAGTEWQRFRGRLSPGRDARDAVLVLMAVGKGTVYLDAASLMPVAVNDGGIRTDVAKLAQAMHAPVIRYPGGCFVDGYRWEDGIGPRERRPISDNRKTIAAIKAFFMEMVKKESTISEDELERLFDVNTWKPFEPNDFGTDEFVRFCRMVGAEPFITVNFGSGTPEEAANWVAYCNGPADEGYGAKRAANGHREPYKVKYWGVGNEIWGPHEVGHCSAEEYGRRFVRFAEAMRAVDPAIKLVAVGAMPEGPFEDWNAGVLGTEAANTMDYLSVHQYFGALAGEQADSDAVAQALTVAPLRTGALLDKTRETIERVAGNGNRIGIVLEEWGTWHGHMLALAINAGIGPYRLSDGLFAAGILHAMQRRCESVTMGNMAQLVNTIGAIRANATGSFGTAYHTVFKLFTENCLSCTTPVEVEGPVLDAAAAAGAPAMEGVPLLDAAATRDEAGKRLAVTVINRSLEHSVTADVSFEGFAPSKARALEMNAESIHTANTFDEPDAIRVTEKGVDAGGGRIACVFAPHSLTFLVLE